MNEELIQRFWKLVAKRENSCWEWTGTIIKQGDGYGQIKLGRFNIYTHRLSWEIHHGTIPKGMKVCHKCDNGRCCNPEHLFLGTQKDNIKDYWDKNRPAGAFKGVSFINCKQKWKAYYRLGTKTFSLGMHLTQTDALNARNKFLAENPNLPRD